MLGENKQKYKFDQDFQWIIEIVFILPVKRDAVDQNFMCNLQKGISNIFFPQVMVQSVLRRTNPVPLEKVVIESSKEFMKSFQ